MSLEAGGRDVKIALLRRTTAHDGYQKVESWSLLGYRWASRRPLPGGERAEGAARRSFARYSLWLLRDTLAASLTSADAVAFAGRRFELTEPARPIDKPARAGIELLVEDTGEVWSAV